MISDVIDNYNGFLVLSDVEYGKAKSNSNIKKTTTLFRV